VRLFGIVVVTKEIALSLGTVIVVVGYVDLVDESFASLDATFPLVNIMREWGAALPVKSLPPSPLYFYTNT
jgi:hypothetical protein